MMNFVAFLLFSMVVSGQDVDIDKDRYFASIQNLGVIGSYLDPLTRVFGVRRPGLTYEDGVGRRLVEKWFEEAGLVVNIDQIGNIWGTRPGLDNSLAPVVCGSHIDSVNTGGKFDGPVGVLGALEVVNTLNDHNITTLRPLIIAIYTDEEGRFGGLVGSGVATDIVPLEDAYAQTDRDGNVLFDELDTIGYVGGHMESIIPHAHLELHIEQGPILGNEVFDIGVVTGIPAIWGFDVIIQATGGHAGATPVEYRSDAGLTAAQINIKLREMAASGRYGTDMRVTMGIIETREGSENVIPSFVRTSIDLRNPMEEMQERVMDDIKTYAELVKDNDVTIEWNERFQLRAALMDDEMQEIITDCSQKRGYTLRQLPSGAGHDSQHWAEVTKSGMIFIPGENNGISHNPLEYSTPEQCEKGANVLLDAVLHLANQE